MTLLFYRCLVVGDDEYFTVGNDSHKLYKYHVSVPSWNIRIE